MEQESVPDDDWGSSRTKVSASFTSLCQSMSLSSGINKEGKPRGHSLQREPTKLFYVSMCLACMNVSAPRVQSPQRTKR